MKKVFYFILGLSLFLTVAFSFFTGCKKKTTFTSHYSPNGEKKGFTVSLDSIGLVKKVSTNFDSLKARLSQLGYVIARRVSLGMVIVVPVKKKRNTQAQIIQLVKGLIQTNKNLLESGGMVVYPDSSKIPFFVNDEIIVQFKPSVSQQQKDNYFSQHGLTVLQQNGYRPQQYVVIPANSNFTDIFKKITEITDTTLTKSVNPNFIIPVFLLSYRPDDPLYDLQWHIVNGGQGGGALDADSDADLAWEFFTKGDPRTTIAILDYGVDITHPDLSPNWAINIEERDGRPGIDDNPHEPGRPNEVDDVIGWNFQGCGQFSPPGCGTPTFVPNEHATAVTGIAAAKGNNTIGITGICPECTVLPVHIGSSDYSIAKAFDYAVSRGAKIISCSFLYPAGYSPDQSIKDAHTAGVTVFVAADNEELNNCSGISADLTSLSEVISVSRASNLDKYDLSGFGTCIDVLAPAYHENKTGTMGMVTTDLTGPGALGNACLVAQTITLPGYTSCFYGTSSATPLVAGIAGLILSVNPDLSPNQIQFLLQDCADKIENSSAKYFAANGFSGSGTHGYGRVNAYEAVKIASPDLAQGGRNGVDVFFRDNYLDWGNTEKPSNTLFEPTRTFIPHWHSEDIKIDAPPFGPAPANNSAFESMGTDRPLGNATNKVYVRVRNRGYNPAAIVDVKLYWVYGGLALPALWSGFPQDATADPVWKFLGKHRINDLQYSGSSGAFMNTMLDDGSQIVVFDFRAPDPASNPVNHYCLLAMLDSPEDLLPVTELSAISDLDMVTPNYNNITHKNFSIETPQNAPLQYIYINNPYRKVIRTKISIFNPKKIPIRLLDIYPDSFFTLKPLERRLVKIDIKRFEIKEPTEITLKQELWVDGKKRGTGGFTFQYINKK